MIIIDLETTGLDPFKHEIIEIGAIDVDTGETFEVKVHPIRIKEAEPEAMRVNGFDAEEWANEAFMLTNALYLLNQFVGNGRPAVMGYNVSFDRAFLERAYVESHMKYPFHYLHLDLMTLAWYRFRKTLSLKNVCEALDIEPEANVHRALAGAKCAYEVYKKLI